MISDLELDRSLRAWLAPDAGARAPMDRVAAALGEIEHVSQRRPIPLVRSVFGRADDLRPRGRSLLIIAALLLLAAAAALGAAAVLSLRDAPLPPLPPLQSTHFEEHALDVALPGDWSLVEERCCELLRFKGPDSLTTLSIDHDAPMYGVVCRPECAGVEIPFFLPYSATKQLDAFSARISELTGSDAWVSVSPDVVPSIDGARRLDVSTVDASGAETRQVYVIGVHEQRIVAITWIQRRDAFDERLLLAVLNELGVSPGAGYATGAFVDLDDAAAGFAVRVPDLWAAPSQPELDGAPASGVRDFYEGALVISVGDPDGSVRICDVGCHAATATSLDELEASLDAGYHGTVEIDDTGAVDVSGDPGRFQRVTRTGAGQTITQLVRVFALHDGRPVILRFDVTDGTTDRSIIDAVVSSLRLSEPPPPSVLRTFEGPGKGFTISLPDSWITATEGLPDGWLTRWMAANDADPGSFYLSRGTQVLMVRAGAPDGAIRTCDRSAAPFETCEDVRVGTLNELGAAVEPEPISEPGISPPIVTREIGSLDGEPALIYHVEAYEHPAHGAQFVVYVVAVHGGRPFVIRIWNPSEGGIVGLDEVIMGFAFAD